MTRSLALVMTLSLVTSVASARSKLTHDDVVPPAAFPTAPYTQAVRDILRYYETANPDEPHNVRVNRRNKALRDLFASLRAQRLEAQQKARAEWWADITVPARSRREAIEELPPSLAEIDPSTRRFGNDSGHFKDGTPTVIPPRSVKLIGGKAGSGTAQPEVFYFASYSPEAKAARVEAELARFRDHLATNSLPDDQIPDMPEVMPPPMGK